MNATDTKFRSRSGAARKKSITARRRASLVIAAAAAAALAIPAAAAEFAVHGGNLTELAGSPGSMPAGATPAGILANQPVPANDQVNTALLDFLRS